MNRQEQHELTTSLIDALKLYSVKPAQPISVPTYKSAQTEDILVLSDWQIGHKTPTFNGPIAKSRILKLCSYLKSHAETSKSHTLNIFVLGDMVHGERVGKTVTLDELEMPVKEQMFDYCIPLLNQVISTGLSSYKTVKVTTVRGNHGILDRNFSNTTNLDDFIYYFCKEHFSGEKRLTFTISENFYKIVKVMGFPVFLAHGDAIKSGATKVPFNAITTRVQNWLGSAGYFVAAFLGHFHTFGVVDFNGIVIVENGALPTDDEWCLKNFGYSGSCCQVLLTLDKKGFNNAVIRKIGLR